MQLKKDHGAFSSQAFPTHSNRERYVEALKYAANSLEKGESFLNSIASVLTMLERSFDLACARVDFLDSNIDGPSSVLTAKAKEGLSPKVEQAIQSAKRTVTTDWRYRMMPVASSDIQPHHAFRADRGGKAYVLCLPIKCEEQKIGTLTVVKMAYGNFEPKSEMEFLSVLSTLIAQSSLIKRFHPEAISLEPQKQVEKLKSFDRCGIIGNSKAMARVFHLIEQVSTTDTSVLITGECGVGKELIAQAIHRNSIRRQKPFIKVNCATMPDHCIEAELFGVSEQGASSENPARPGRLERANGGTIFLDEVADLAPTTQIKLLRLIQDGQYEKVGSSKATDADIRIIVATDRDLLELTEQKKFRQDLFYKLNVFPIHVPELKERKTDIIPIADHFIEVFSKLHNRKITRLSTPAIDLLSSYHWPGNIRELENCIERAVLLTKESVIRGHHLPPSLQMAEPSEADGSHHLQAVLDSMEKELILDALKDSRGNMAKAARELGLTERVMGLRTKKYNIEAKKFKKHLSH